MNRWFVIGLIAVILLIIIGSAFYMKSDNDSNDGNDREIISARGNTVLITENGFTPENLVIELGDSVTFINRAEARSWPATDVHPTHREYPGSDISKCGSNEESTLFDSCRGLEQGESYTFTFNEAGTWEYHDHLNPRFSGSVEVE